MTNVVGLQTDDAGHVDQNSSAHVARIVGLQTDAAVVTETRFKRKSKSTGSITFEPETGSKSRRSYSRS